MIKKIEHIGIAIDNVDLSMAVFDKLLNKKSYKSIFDFSVYTGAVITIVIFLQNYL